MQQPNNNNNQHYHQPPPTLYRVVGGRKHVAKSEAGMQTDTSSATNVLKHQQQQQPQLQQPQNQPQIDWKKAMAHNARVLSSQEKAMDEYLRRQRAAAEQHIQAANNQMQIQQRLVGTKADGRGSSIPATPKETRRAMNGSSRQHYFQQQRHHSTLTSPSKEHAAGLGASRSSNGGSLERQQVGNKMKVDSLYSAYSDSEYGRLLGSPMASRKSSSHAGPSPPTNANPMGNKRDPTFGSRSLPKGTSSLNYGLMLDRIQQKRQYRPSKTNDGSLSDSNYATYTDLQGMRSGSQSPYSWLQPASTYSPSTVQDQYAPWMTGQAPPPSNPHENESISVMSDIMGSNESLNSVSSSIQQARANSLTKARLMMHQRSLSPRNSLKRSQQQQQQQQLQQHEQQQKKQQQQQQQQQQKQVPLNLQSSEHSFASNSSTATPRMEETDYYGVPFRLGINQESNIISRFKSQPTSPVRAEMSSMPVMDSGNVGTNYSSLPCYKSNPNSARPSLERDQTGSNLSLAISNGYANQQEAKTDFEIRKLRQELVEEHEKVQNLTTQLATNAHVVSAFEQSLGNMTSRLHQLTNTAEKKDNELAELRRTIDRLRQSGADAGLIKQNHELMRQTSTDSVLSACSATSNQSGDEGGGGGGKSSGKSGPKRSGWLRNSFSKAFSRSNSHSSNANSSKHSKNKGGSISDAEDGSITKMLYEAEEPSSDPHQRCASAASGSVHQQPIKNDNTRESSDGPEIDLVDELKRQLEEKDSLLTETRLEALSSAHQLESLRETVTKMRNELMSLKTDNDKLQTIMTTQKSLASSQSSLNGSGNSGERRMQSEGKRSVDDEDGTNFDDEEERRLSMAMSEVSVLSGPSSLDLSASTDPTNKDGGKLVTVSVAKPGSEDVRLGVIAVSGKSNWDLLDSLVHRLFKEYVMRVDPVSNLGLNADSIARYQVGEVLRTKTSERPEFLPYGYLVGSTTNIGVHLRQSSDNGHVDALAFETLTPKSILQRYVSLLTEHKRIILSGPIGTGKTFMAKKLARFLVHRPRNSISSSSSSMSSSPSTPVNHQNEQECITLFEVNPTNVNELRQYLAKLSDKCTPGTNSSGRVVPRVLILDNLHHAGNLDEVFNGFLTATLDHCPYIIGTLNQQQQTATTNLQLRHNFRWVLCANHVEPVRGFLGRYLRQKLLTVETRTRVYDGEMAAVLEWMARVHLHLNKFLESNTSAEFTLGPQHFLSCPVHDLKASRTWFINLWNFSLVPHLLDALHESIQMGGMSSVPSTTWEDPLRLIVTTWPWTEAGPPMGDELGNDGLTPIRPQDFGLDVKSARPAATNKIPGTASQQQQQNLADDGGKDGDPLFSMLMHLQEAAVGNNAATSGINNSSINSAQGADASNEKDS